jgi:cohesin complex subunit SA-1/2
VVNNKDLVDDMDDDDDRDDSSVDDHVILRLRNRLLSLLELCFSQYIPSADEHADDDTTVAKHSNDQIRFADYVQLAAGRTSSDLRVLFSKDFADAENPLLRAVALQDDGRLVGAYVRFVNAKEHLLRENEVASKENKMLAQSLLLPMGRAIANNWARGNRREAGVFLRHISSAGPTATAIVSSACDQMKKVDSVRMLESQMASLRQSYENWVDEEPDMENDKPSEEEMKDFEEAEKRHKEQFEYLEHRAAQFSKKLGVFGKLSDAKLRPALNGFIKEGIRFSFSNLDNNGEDSLVLGSRLSFLSILSKYASWIKRDKQAKKEIQKFIDEKEVEMKNHEEFDDVHEDDLGALATFRVTLGLKNIPKASSYGAEEDEEMGIDEASDGVNELQSPVASVSSRASKASRASSKASSRVSSLPALLEGDKESPQDSDEDSHFSAAGSSSDNKRKSQTQNTYEESDENDSDDSSLGLGYSQKSKVSQKSKASQKSKKARRSK